MLKPKPNQFIGAWTAGMMELPSETREAVEKEFQRQIREIEDWFYTIEIPIINKNGFETGKQKFFVAENGEFGYTAMLPDEY